MLLTLLLTVAASIGLANAFADPLPCKGNCRNSHDPTIIRRSSDGKYFRFATGGRVGIHTAPSIIGPWTGAGVVLPSSGSSIDNPGSKFVWAPDVYQVGDTYYLYYAISTFGSQDSAIGVATSKTMDAGSWTDHGGVGISSKPGDKYNAIDPNLIVAGGKKYLTFGSYSNGIHQTTMSADGLTASKTAPHQLEHNTTWPYASEGANVFAHRGYYYLFWSSGSCCGYNVHRPAPGDEYKIMVCRSKSVDGDYVDENGKSCLKSGGTLVLGSHGSVYGPGGQGVYDDPEYGPVLYYHHINTNVGYGDGDKMLGVNKIDFSSGWPRV
ncbi:arabinan endo-1,5-alpha-L-arabinosidase A [Teratosphaeria nubilosa]|uniref:Arabinan endo-1,5-alpha-L-arabinosidase n=1 Tax=Teratosphaeria nubilosa TaxID=161662 RepID=A0A6G1L1T4_9PEZI|nr:arabinan endo-1,5-alpha-L-arabinosidase A [Teratosphaeria nubilosa]